MFRFLARRRPTTSPCTFHELDSLDSPWGQQALTIYLEAFPEAEREPLDDLRAERLAPSTPQAEHHFRIMVDESGDVLGLSIFSTVHGHYMAFLRYLAVHPSARNRGFGRLLLNDALHTVRADGWKHAGYPYLGLVFEVERPSEAETDTERIVRERRIGWYMRNGARLYPTVDLTTPPVSPDQPPVSYHLMFRTAVPKRIVGRMLHRMMVESVLVHGYGVAPDSRYVRRAMAE